MKRQLYLDKKSNELENLLNGKKSLIVRGANIKKYPFEMIHEGYHVFFMNNNKENIIKASGIVSKTDFFENTNQTKEKLNAYLEQAMLTNKKKQYIVDRKYVSVMFFKDIRKEFATLDHSQYGKKDDWMIIHPIKEME